jgi:FAD/FMN-containing dehydrogenase
MIDRHPALIARCTQSRDVVRCVRFARRHGLVLTVRGGGHNIGGRALAEGGLMVDLSRQREVAVRAEEGVADVAPGALLGDVDRATLAHSLIVPTGIISETGIAGLTLGGGFGWLSRRFGLTCDHLLRAEVVTGTGEVVVASEAEHPDLLWALRGGGFACVRSRIRSSPGSWYGITNTSRTRRDVSLRARRALPSTWDPC